MKKALPLLVFLVVGVFLYLSLNSDPNKLPSPLIGKKFPIIEGTDFYSNETVKLNDLMDNKLALVNVWASWCVSCRKEHQVMMNIAKNNNLKLIGINYKDSRIDAKEYLKVMGNPFDEIVFDPKGQIGMELGVYATPETFIIGRDGLIIHKHIGEITEKDWIDFFSPHFESIEG